MRPSFVLLLALASAVGCTAGSNNADSDVDDASSLACADGVGYRFSTTGFSGSERDATAIEGVDDGNGTTSIVISGETAEGQRITAEYVVANDTRFSRFDGHPGPFVDGTWYDSSESNRSLVPRPTDAPLGTHRDAARLWAALGVDTSSFADGAATNEATVSTRRFEEAVGHDVTAFFANPDDTIDVRVTTNDDGCIAEFARRIPGADWTVYEILEMSDGLVGPEISDPQPLPG